MPENRTLWWKLLLGLGNSFMAYLNGDSLERGNANYCGRWWSASKLLIESRVSQNNRKFHFRDFWSLSSDGAALTMTHRGDDLAAGQVTVLVRDVA